MFLPLSLRIELPFRDEFESYFGIVDLVYTFVDLPEGSLADCLADHVATHLLYHSFLHSLNVKLNIKRSKKFNNQYKYELIRK